MLGNPSRRSGILQVFRDEHNNMGTNNPKDYARVARDNEREAGLIHVLLGIWFRGQLGSKRPNVIIALMYDEPAQPNLAMLAQSPKGD